MGEVDALGCGAGARAVITGSRRVAGGDSALVIAADEYVLFAT